MMPSRVLKKKEMKSAMLKNVDDCETCGLAVVRLGDGKWYHWEDCVVGPVVRKHRNAKYSGETKFDHGAIPKRDSHHPQEPSGGD